MLFVRFERFFVINLPTEPSKDFDFINRRELGLTFFSWGESHVWSQVCCKQHAPGVSIWTEFIFHQEPSISQGTTGCDPNSVPMVFIMTIIITCKYPPHRAFIGISHRDTLVGVHPTIQ